MRVGYSVGAKVWDSVTIHARNISWEQIEGIVLNSDRGSANDNLCEKIWSSLNQSVRYNIKI